MHYKTIMLEERLMEQAESYVLGQLSKGEKSGFERELLSNQELQKYLDDLAEGVAAVACRDGEVLVGGDFE